MKDWDGAVAFVTGGGSGIGKALCLGLAKRGARVTVTDVEHRTAAEVATLCGPGASARALDVRDAGAVQGAIAEVAAAHGRLDYVFNNAGIGVGGEVQDLTLAHWDRILDVNVRGVVHGVAAAYPLMVRQGHGHIVNTASLAGLVATPMVTLYSMTKHAVVGLSNALRYEGAALGVRVSALCPAAIETPLLDSDNPPDLPPVWRPDVRAFLTRLAGPPYPVDAFADEALAAIARNEGTIVIPGRARLIWRLARMAPGLLEKAGIAAVKQERAARCEEGP